MWVRTSLLRSRQPVTVSEQKINFPMDQFRRDTETFKHVANRISARENNSQNQMFGPDIVVMEQTCLVEGSLHHRFYTGVERKRLR